jgi:hypothetical protein
MELKPVENEAHCNDCGTDFYDGDQAYCQEETDGSCVWYCEDCREFCSVLEKYRNQEKAWSTEGRTGVENLCRICHAIGYVDNFASNGSYGDLIEFLKDNSGAVQALLEWMKENANDDWRDSLESRI